MCFYPNSKSIFVPLVLIDTTKERLLFHTQSSTPLSKNNGSPKEGYDNKKSNENCNHIHDTQVIINNEKKSEQLKQAQLKQCTCSKTKCLKKYCECYANGLFCIGCNCKDCFNRPIYQSRTQNESMTQEMTCTCAKSNCNKKYCECYKNGNSCNDKCRCVNCLNKKALSFFIMERTSIYIHNEQIDISKEVINISKSLGNKRARDAKDNEE